MREIKFRAFEKDSGEMFVPSSLNNHEDFFVGTDDEGTLKVSEGAYGSSDGYVLMQYTGLRDKDGREIYEGDIVRRDFEIGHTNYDPNTLAAEVFEITDSGYFVGVVRYRPSEGFVLGKVRKYNDNDELVEKKSAVKIYPRYAKVIGDIHSNPELLEVAE